MKGTMQQHKLTELATQRKVPVEAVVDAVHVRAGLSLVNGFDRLVGGTGVVDCPRHLPTASVTQLREAHLLPQRRAASMVWQTDPIPDRPASGGVAFVWPMAIGAGSPFPQPTGHFGLTLNGAKLLSLMPDKRSRRWEGGGASLTFDAQWVKTSAPGESFSLDPHITHESALADGFAVLLVPPHLVEPGRPARLGLVVDSEFDSTRWVRVGRTVGPFASENVLPALSLAIAGTQPRRIGRHQVVFGDLHNHSGQSTLSGMDGCGRGSRASLFDYARDVAGLDFFCLSEHDWQMSEQDWRDLGALTEQYDDPGRFVTIPGFEWTSPAYGHRNVYFRDQAGPLHRSGPVGTVNQMHAEDPTPADLWRSLDGAGQRALTIPHHMSAAQFPLNLDDFHHPDYDRVAEIYSCWGDSLEHAEMATLMAHRIQERAFIHAVRHGYRVGFVASSDSHDGHPGNAQGTDSHNHLFHFLGSGLTGALVDSFDRAAVFDAIAARRCYALTGGLLTADVTLEGHPMGSEVTATDVPDRRELHIQIDSNSPLHEVVIYRNGEPVDRLTTAGCTLETTWTDDNTTPTSETSYFVKVTRADHEMAWTSPIWVLPV